MIRSRPKPKVKAGPPLSDDRFDKFIAAMSWYVGKKKDDPEYVVSAVLLFGGVGVVWGAVAGRSRAGSHRDVRLLDARLWRRGSRGDVRRSAAVRACPAQRHPQGVGARLKMPGPQRPLWRQFVTDAIPPVFAAVAVVLILWLVLNWDPAYHSVGDT